MRFLTFQQNGAERVGVLGEEKGLVYPLPADKQEFGSMLALIEAYGDSLRNRIEQLIADTTPLALAHITLCAPIPRPRHDLLCFGENYLEHALESARFKGVEYQKPEYPLYFSKRVLRAVGHGEIIPAHEDVTDKLDYEAELAVVIGKRCAKVSREKAWEYIFGYTVANDVSARDLQMRYRQFTVGKGLDGFCPMGPWIVTADELPCPPHLAVRSYVNGEVRQNSNTEQFIFDIPHMISELSAGITLEPGDILLTGTPSGVGMGFTPPKFLQKGDVVRCEVEGIGAIENPVGQAGGRLA